MTENRQFGFGCGFGCDWIIWAIIILILLCVCCPGTFGGYGCNG